MRAGIGPPRPRHHLRAAQEDGGMPQVLTTRFALVHFERLMVFFVAWPVRNLAWFAAVVPAKHKVWHARARRTRPHARTPGVGEEGAPYAAAAACPRRRCMRAGGEMGRGSGPFWRDCGDGARRRGRVRMGCRGMRALRLACLRSSPPPQPTYAAHRQRTPRACASLRRRDDDIAPGGFSSLHEAASARTVETARTGMTTSSEN